MRVIYKYPIYGPGGSTITVLAARPIVRSFRYQPMNFHNPELKHNPEPWVVYIEHDLPKRDGVKTDVWVFAAQTGDPLPDLIRNEKTARFIDTASAGNGYTLHLYAQVQ